MTRAVLPNMMRAGWGRIVTIGSRMAVDPGAKCGAYSVSKAGLVALTRTIAAETVVKGVTANVVLPRTIDPPANRAPMPSADPGSWVSPAAVADLVLWLASDGAARSEARSVGKAGGHTGRSWGSLLP